MSETTPILDIDSANVIQPTDLEVFGSLNDTDILIVTRSDGTPGQVSIATLKAALGL